MNEIGELRLPTAVWAWQGLRRNQNYRREYRAELHYAPSQVTLVTGATLLRPSKRYEKAEKWGLLCFADPDKPTTEANVFWKPNLLAGALRVRLTPYYNKVIHAPGDHDIVVLSALKTRRVIFDAIDGVRHILLSGERFWVQLYCDTALPVGDEAVIRIRIDDAVHGQRRLDTATQLLSLHRSAGQKLSLIGRNNPPRSTITALKAFDIIHGFERPKGGIEDVAAMLTSANRMMECDGAMDRNLRVQAQRWVTRGEKFVARDYLDLLTRKTI